VFADVTVLIDHGTRTQPPADVAREARLKLSGGQPTATDSEVCMDTSQALAAARHYLRSQTRPDWLSYQYVR